MLLTKQLLNNNAQWAAKCLKEDPNYFKDLAAIQQPDYLWIGCSDARVPANTIVGLKPGEVFVHRNIANQVAPSDMNCLSVIQFAVEYLHVKQIIVCGHYGCAGVVSALERRRLGLIDHWLKPIQELSWLYRQKLDLIQDPTQKANRLCELNVRRQVFNVCATNFVREAWEKGRELSVVGMIYNINDGLLKNLDLCVSQKDQADQMFPAL